MHEVCACVYVYVFTYIYVCMWCVYVCVHCVYVMYVCMWFVHMCLCIRMCVCVSVYVYVCNVRAVLCMCTHLHCELTTVITSFFKRDNMVIQRLYPSYGCVFCLVNSVMRSFYVIESCYKRTIVVIKL